MKRITIEELLSKAKNYKNNNISWHHHFLTPTCHFNDTKKFCIILENEGTSEIFKSEFNKKPEKELKELEKLFFN